MRHIKLKGLCAVMLSVCMSVNLTVGAAAQAVNPADAYASFVGGGQADTSAEIRIEDPQTTMIKQNEVPDVKRTVNIPAEGLNVYSYQTSIYVGDSFRIGYRLTPDNSDDYVTYTSTDTSVLTVNDSGKVVAVGRGNAVITVTTSSGVRERFTVYVKKGGSNSDMPYIELEKTNIDLVTGESYHIVASVGQPSDAGTITYRTLNAGVATVDSNGIVTATGEGSTRIVCTAASGVYTVLEVNVSAQVDIARQDQEIEESIDREYDEYGNLLPSRVKIVQESETVKVNEKKKLSFRIYPSGSLYTYSFESSDPSVVEVTSKGTIKGISPGTATVTVTTDNGKSDSIMVTVYSDVLRGIDISRHNGDIDFKALKESGEVDFVMIRASFGYEDTDIRLEQNVKGCEKYGIPYGFYHYTYATSVSEAKKEAAFFLNVISKYSPSYPIVLDIEETKIYNELSREKTTKIVKTFMNAFEKAGYYAMIYSFAKFFGTNVYMGDLVDYDIWIACWGDEEKLANSFSYSYGMWQYSDSGIMDGIDEYVDLNYSYLNYPEIIKNAHLNGY